jgi:hypothetical protein
MYPNHRTIHMCCNCRAQSNAIIGERTVVPSQDSDDVTETFGTGRSALPPKDRRRIIRAFKSAQYHEQDIRHVVIVQQEAKANIAGRH